MTDICIHISECNIQNSRNGAFIVTKATEANKVTKELRFFAETEM